MILTATAPPADPGVLHCVYCGRPAAPDSDFCGPACAFEAESDVD